MWSYSRPLSCFVSLAVDSQGYAHTALRWTAIRGGISYGSPRTSSVLSWYLYASSLWSPISLYREERTTLRLLGPLKDVGARVGLVSWGVDNLNSNFVYQFPTDAAPQFLSKYSHPWRSKSWSPASSLIQSKGLPLRYGFSLLFLRTPVFILIWGPFRVFYDVPTVPWSPYVWVFLFSIYQISG